jgi:hypothetical protein
MMKNSTPEQRKKGMDAWIKWMDATKQSIVDGGAPLGKPSALIRMDPLTQKRNWRLFDCAG